ncbi:MAG TPA: TrkH family potassium uptake protein [Bacillales bacterium]|nr:TrkH family potassium uptake protein [Bacillales bacterium]
MENDTVKGIPAKQRKKLSPPQILVLGFLALITAGAILLKLPIATTQPITWLDAFFTATSATDVTGLIVLDTATAFTLFGKIVILCLIQIGGLGIMTFAILIFLLMGKKISFKQRLVIQNALNQSTSGGIVKLVKTVLLFTLSIEGIGALLLAIYWIPKMGWGKGIFFSIFHTISAFNNAGFALWSHNLLRWVSDPIVNIVICALIIIGGLGFTVLVNLLGARHLHDLSLHTKFMLVGTLLINAFAFVMIFALEFNNPGTLGHLSLGGKMWGAFFQAVTTRTAGFNTVPIGNLREATLFLMILLMFVGGGSTSTAGGIKVTTFIALLMSVAKILRGEKDAVAFGRTIKDSIFMKAFALVVASLTFIFIAIFILTLTENASFIHIAFEVVSAFGTVGLSAGLTAHLSVAGQIVIMFMMFIGKLGPLTLVFSLAAPEVKKIRYPEGKLFIG